MRFSILVPTVLALATVSGCSDDATLPEPAEVGERTVAELIGSSEGLAAFDSAADRTGISEVFEGPGGYTVLAPDNEALASLTGESPDSGDNAILAAILRDHIVPGQLDLEAIGDAIDANGGTAAIATVGSGTLEFTREGETIAVRLSGSERSARLSGSQLQGSNGAVLPIDRLLVVPPSEQSPDQ